MTDQEKINKMAEDICRQKHNCNDACNPINSCMAMKYAYRAYLAGYRLQSEGQWEIVIGSNGKEKMVCTNCRHQQDLASTFIYCPNCGARMKGTVRK